MINTKYKTMLCRHVQNGNICPLAEKCHFAHSDSELRRINDVYRYKEAHPNQRAPDETACKQPKLQVRHLRLFEQKQHETKNDEVQVLRYGPVQVRIKLYLRPRRRRTPT